MQFSEKMKNNKFKKGFTLIELMIVMLIIGIGLMSATPKFTAKSVGMDPLLEHFNELIKNELARSRELQRPVAITGSKGTANLLNSDMKSENIPGGMEVKNVKINRYETQGNQYKIQIYPDGICDYFEITFSDGRIIESIPLLMTTRFKTNVED